MNNVRRKVIGFIRANPGGKKGADKSPEEQAEEIKAYAEAEGLELIKIYREKVLGGNIANQDELNEMYKEISEGRADTILMYKGGRITRRWSFQLLNKEKS